MYMELLALLELIGHIINTYYDMYIYIPSQVVRNGCFTWRGRPAHGTNSAGDALREGLSTTLLGFGPVNFVEAYPDAYPFSTVLLAALALAKGK